MIKELHFHRFADAMGKPMYEARVEGHVYVIARHYAPSHIDKPYPWALHIFEAGKYQWDKGEKLRTYFGSSKTEMVDKAKEVIAHYEHFTKEK